MTRYCYSIATRIFKNHGIACSTALSLLNGILEVSGSIPLISTRGKGPEALYLQGFPGSFYILANGWESCKILSYCYSYCYSVFTSPQAFSE